MHDTDREARPDFLRDAIYLRLPPAMRSARALNRVLKKSPEGFRG
jgi:hypothetical protein